ncbi:MAG: hypothetical protein ACRERD_29950 [Candidatus Binatia bacterium]
MGKAFSYEQAELLAEVFKHHEVEYLFLGKSGAIILGYPDTTQDADVFLEKTPDNGRKTVAALRALGFPLSEHSQQEIVRGKDFVQLRTGPFDLDLVFAPDGIETFAEAKKKSLVIEGIAVCHIDDIIRSKKATGRVKDREALPRLEAFRTWWLENRQAR